jgi:DNA-binding MarR family transcriptional regulator
MNTARARRADPETSHAAAASMSRFITQAERKVLDALRSRGEAGATSEELARFLAVPLVNVSPRMRPLADKGYVVDSGVTRKGASGRGQIVWRVSAPAQAKLL